jgi:capsid protein
MELPPNKEAIVPNWNIPNQNFKTSTEVWLHAIATGLHVSYDSLTSDGGNTNYSSGRLNSIVERDVWQSRSAWLVRNFHEKVYAKFIEVQTNMPKAPLQLPTSNSDDFLDVVFLPVSFDWVDPLKDIKMWVEARNMNWVSDTYVSNQLGVNYAETLQQIADDTVRRDALGVAPPLAMTPLQVDTAVETHTDKTGNAADTSLGDTTVDEHTSSTDGTDEQNI